MPETLTATSAVPSVGADAGGAAPAPVESPSIGSEQPLGAPESGAETAEPEAGIESGAPDQINQGEEADPDGDGRLLPNAIRALKETDPKAYKQLKGQFFENRAYKGHFQTVAEAAKAKQVLELAGGEAGITQLQSDMGEFKQVAQQFMNGDPAFVSDLAETDPAAFGAHTPSWLDTYQKVDSEGYNREMARRISTEHKAVGLRPAIENAYSLIQSGKTDEALAVLEKMAGWHDKLDGIAKQEEDPKYKKLQQELRQERESKTKDSDKQFFEAYKSEVTASVNSSAERILDSYLKGRNIDKESRALLLKNAISLANEELSKDETFIKQRDLLFGRRDQKASARYGATRFEQALGPAVSRVMRAFGKLETKPVAGKPAAQAPAKQAAPAGWERVSKAPMNIDRNQTTASMILNEKKAITKDGKKVTWAT